MEERLVSSEMPVSESGSAIDRPSLMACLVFINASSTTTFPADLLTIFKPSRIGTPELIMVAIVRENLATATFFMTGPKIGALRMAESMIQWPFSVL